MGFAETLFFVGTCALNSTAMIKASLRGFADNERMSKLEKFVIIKCDMIFLYFVWLVVCRSLLFLINCPSWLVIMIVFMLHLASYDEPDPIILGSSPMYTKGILALISGVYMLFGVAYFTTCCYFKNIELSMDYNETLMNVYTYLTEHSEEYATICQLYGPLDIILLSGAALIKNLRAWIFLAFSKGRYMLAVGVCHGLGYIFDYFEIRFEDYFDD